MNLKGKEERCEGEEEEEGCRGGTLLEVREKQVRSGDAKIER